MDKLRFGLFLVGGIALTFVVMVVFFAVVSPAVLAPQSPNATATPTPTATDRVTPTPTPTPTATPVPTTPTDAGPTTTPTPTPRQEPVDTAAVASMTTAHLVDYQDDPRTARSEALFTDSATAEKLSALARNHSDRMAAHGYVVHRLDGVSTVDRYRRYGLGDCRLVNDNQDHVVDLREQEVVYGIDVAGRSDAELARAIANGLMSRHETRFALSLEGASSMGIGVNVTDGRAYVTVAVC